MNFILLTSVLLSLSASATDWSDPPVACIEDLVPKFLPCPDLTMVTTPFGDLPPGWTEAEKKYWLIDHRPDLNLCRAHEVQRREAASPGSQSAGSLGTAWMWVQQSVGLPEKISAIYDAAESADMPPQILFGALKQESLLSNLGISVDGANFSCGIGQINVIEWCQYMRTLSPGEAIAMGWPVGVSCNVDTLTPELVRPFYEIAMRRLAGRPDYELTPAEFAGIQPGDVVPAFPAGSETLQAQRFAAVTSFVKYCSDLSHGIAAKGKELRRLFDMTVPNPLRLRETYRAGQGPRLACQRPYRSTYFPLHTGWLLADAIYNAGGREVALLQYYYRMTVESHESGKAWEMFTPLKLIEGLHWGGKWSESAGKITYTSVYGNEESQPWFKSCVVQRHIASVIQYAARPGETIAKSLEQVPCSRTGVPEYRKKSPGRVAKNPRRPHF